MIGGTAANRNGYIGRNPSDSSVVIDKQTFTASQVLLSPPNILQDLLMLT